MPQPGGLFALINGNTFIGRGEHHCPPNAMSSAPLVLSPTLVNDVGMHTLPPTTILDNLTLVTVTAVPPIRPTHDSQAVEITLDTPARPSHEGSRPSLAMQNDPRTGYHL
ncbi:hypothetical protein GGG16DRAFT_120014 [Schizophyllum commune]